VSKFVDTTLEYFTLLEPAANIDPYHDAAGKFTTADGAVSKAAPKTYEDLLREQFAEIGHAGTKAAFASLSKEEKKAIKKYTTESGGRKLKAEIATGQLTDASRALLSGLEKAPKFQGEVFHGISTRVPAGKELVAALEKAGAGGTFTISSPLSTSRSALQSQRFSGTTGPMMRIQSKTGRSVEVLSHLETEKEVVGLPGTVYRIVKVERHVPVHVSTDPRFPTHNASVVFHLEEV
jgi:hypothetical protein